MKLRKIAAMLCATVLALGALGAVAGCGPNNEEVIREAIAKDMDAFKNADDAAIQQIVTADAQAGGNLDEVGIDQEQFAIAQLDGFDYSIDDITVDGDHATATITITSKSASDYAARMEALQEELTNDPSFTELDTDVAMEAYGQRVMELLGQTELSTGTITLDYELKDRTWQPTNASTAFAQLDSILFAQA